MALPLKGRRTERLMLDNVIGSQPELGPAPPDGGYGWVILFGVIMIQITIPSILVTSGLLISHILYDNTSLSIDNAQWIWLPTIFCAAWSLADPWSITMTSVTNSSCMAVSGILLVASGLLAASLFPSNVDIFYMSLGLVAGIGASMATTQSEYLLRKYFNTKFPTVRTIYQVGQAVGEILMPVVIGCLLNKFGLSSTLLLQAGITLQALIGAILFRKPRYVHAKQSNVAYTLLQNEDADESRKNENHESNVPQNVETLKDTSSEVQHNISSADTSDDELIHNDVTHIKTSQNFNIHSDSSIDSLPRPLFSDLELGESSQNTAFFIEDSDDDVDLYVRRAGFTKRTIPCSQELRVLGYPLFYCGLILTTITKTSILAFWILLPLLLKSRLQDFQFYQAILLLSLGGIANFCAIIGSHWLPTLTARHRKFIFISSSFVAAGGLYLIGYSYSWAELVCASLMIRLGTSGVINALQHVFQDAMGASEVVKIHTLLHIFTGLLIMLGMMMLSSDFTFSFKILAWIQLGAGTLWCLQPIFNRLCNIR